MCQANAFQNPPGINRTANTGVVNLSVGDAHWLFNWANVEDYVYVHDATGQTPTDPALYPDWAY